LHPQTAGDGLLAPHCRHGPSHRIHSIFRISMGQLLEIIFHMQALFGFTFYSIFKNAKALPNALRFVLRFTNARFWLAGFALRHHSPKRRPIVTFPKIRCVSHPCPCAPDSDDRWCICRTAATGSPPPSAAGIAATRLDSTLVWHL
jgi:hypothetical protein